MELAIKIWRKCKKLVSDSQTKKYAFERQVYTEHDTRLNDNFIFFFHRKMFAFSVGVRVHISSVLNWFSFRLHFISANSFRDAFICIRTVRQNYGVGNCSPESCIALCQRDEQFYFYSFKFCRTIKQTGRI